MRSVNYCRAVKIDGMGWLLRNGMVEHRVLMDAWFIKAAVVANATCEGHFCLANISGWTRDHSQMMSRVFSGF